MRQTHTYTSENYRRDNGFPLVWMCTCCIKSEVKGAEVEAQEHFQQRSEARQGKVIGRPAHLARPKKSPAPMTYSPPDQKDREQQAEGDPAKSEEPAKQPQTQASPAEQRDNE